LPAPTVLSEEDMSPKRDASSRRKALGPVFGENAMGFIQPKHIQVKLLKPDLALALTWWPVSFPSFKQKVVGNTTMNLQKFDDGWKIVASHTSIAEM
jgi:hypothetical protein